VVRHFRDHLHIRSGLGEDQLVDAFHIRTGQIDKRLDGCEFVFAFFKRYDDAQRNGLLFDFGFDNRKRRWWRQVWNRLMTFKNMGMWKLIDA